MAKFFAEPDAWRIATSVFAASVKEMSVDGVRGNEGVAMWLGRYEGNIAIVSHVAILRGPRV